MKIPKQHGGKRWLYLLAAMVFAGVYGYWALYRPLPLLNPDQPAIQLKTRAAVSKLSWPGSGQSAAGIVGSQILETHGAQKPAPIASTAKLITALLVLHEKPLTIGSQGPLITIGANDVALYNSYAANEGSVVRVTAGEQISEYQMLQTILLPSANNMADSLAIWAFGSLAGYASSANDYLSGLGLQNTHVGSDASGFAPNTTSTALDLVKLGELAMQNPVLAQIVGQSTAGNIPVAGTIKNVNFLLGTSGIIGVKTGNTDQAGGVFVGAARVTVDNKPLTIVTAVAGSQSLFAAMMKDSLPLIRSAQANFAPVSVIKAGTVVGSYGLPWGGSVPAVAAKDLSATVWNGSTASGSINLFPIPAKSHDGQTVGSITTPKTALAGSKSVPVKLGSSPNQPSAWWRLLHP